MRMTPRNPSRYASGLALLLCLLPDPAAGTPALADLARGLDRAPPAARAAFVHAAVAELTAAYGAVVGHGADAPRWRAATRAYLARLQAAQASAAAGATVRIVGEAAGELRVLVGSAPARQFMLSPPRPGGERALARAIVSRYCRLRGCAGRRAESFGVPATAPGTGLATARSPAPGAAGDGLECAAAGGRHERLAARACVALLADLRVLAAALSAAGPGPLPADTPCRSGARCELPLVAPGRRIALELPALARAAEVWPEIRPWLHARLAGKVAALALTPPARLIYAAR